MVAQEDLNFTLKTAIDAENDKGLATTEAKEKEVERAKQVKSAEQAVWDAKIILVLKNAPTKLCWSWALAEAKAKNNWS